MDPWSMCQIDVNVKETDENTVILSFEDNFKPAIRHTLPDSEQYLASLEEKLHKIKTDPNVLQQLAEKRAACMQELLHGDDTSHENEELELETPVSNSAILRTILPQKQALTQGEVVELVKYDQLVDSEAASESENKSPEP